MAPSKKQASKSSYVLWTPLNQLQKWFGDLDQNWCTSGRYERREKEKEWSGYHKIEKALYEDKKLMMWLKRCTNTIEKDAKELHAKADTLDITTKINVTRFCWLIKWSCNF